MVVVVLATVVAVVLVVDVAVEEVDDVDIYCMAYKNSAAVWYEVVPFGPIAVNPHLLPIALMEDTHPATDRSLPVRPGLAGSTLQPLGLTVVPWQPSEQENFKSLRISARLTPLNIKPKTDNCSKMRIIIFFAFIICFLSLIEIKKLLKLAALVCMSGEKIIWTAQSNLQPISFKSDRLLVCLGFLKNAPHGINCRN